MSGNNSSEVIAGGCLAILVIAVLSLFFTGWLIMLSVGIVHGIFNWPDGTVSYWQGVALAVPFMLISSLFSRGAKS